LKPTFIQVARFFGEYLVKNIFVGNLDFRTGEDELRQLFGKHGQVDRVALMTDRGTGRSRGFAFVEMTNANESDKAIAELNGRELGGRAINVNEARPKPERSGGTRGRERNGSSRGPGRW
jgi:cold-inducible RNA-binding protein